MLSNITIIMIIVRNLMSEWEPFDDGLTLERSAFETLYGGQLTVTCNNKQTTNKSSYLCGLIHSDEGLKLETSVLQSFTVANLPSRPCG